MKNRIEASELILNDDGSVYHLHLVPEQIAKDIIFVGDPDRVKEVSKHFDRIEHQVHKREFITHTGYIGSKRITVISTGIGTDNIDIVFNEIDALFNIDLKNRVLKDELTSLNVIRVGTSGSLQRDIEVDSILLSEYGLGLDGLLNYYVHSNTKKEQEILDLIHANHEELPIKPCIAGASQKLIDLYADENLKKGITITATGFYGPQGRVLRLKPTINNLIEELSTLKFPNTRCTNLEMETASIYGLGKLLGHHCLSVNAILANRQSMEFSAKPQEIVEKAIKMTLEKLCSKN